MAHPPTPEPSIHLLSARLLDVDKGEIVEDAPTAEFFGKPRSERAQVFLSKILQH